MPINIIPLARSRKPKTQTKLTSQSSNINLGLLFPKRCSDTGPARAFFTGVNSTTGRLSSSFPGSSAYIILSPQPRTDFAMPNPTTSSVSPIHPWRQTARLWDDRGQRCAPLLSFERLLTFSGDSVFGVGVSARLSILVFRELSKNDKGKKRFWRLADVFIRYSLARCTTDATLFWPNGRRKPKRLTRRSSSPTPKGPIHL